MEIPNVANNPAPIELRHGDKIMTDANKMKFKVDDSTVGRYRIMNVHSSLISVYTTEDCKLRRLRRITVYQETILSIANSYIVTRKEEGSMYQCKVYRIDNGRVLAKHEFDESCQAAIFSLDESLLFLIDAYLVITVYEAPKFATAERKIALQESRAEEDIKKYNVKSLTCFAHNQYGLLVHYGPEKVGASIKSHYRYVDCLSRDQSKRMNVTPAFETISRDGKIAIDGGLTVYDVKQGVKVLVLTEVLAEGALNGETMQMQLRISEDNK